MLIITVSLSVPAKRVAALNCFRFIVLKHKYSEEDHITSALPDTIILSAVRPKSAADIVLILLSVRAAQYH